MLRAFDVLIATPDRDSAVQVDEVSGWANGTQGCAWTLKLPDRLDLLFNSDTAGIWV